MDDELNALNVGEVAPVPGIATGKKRSRKRSIIIFVVVSLLNVGLLALLWTQLLTPAQSSTQGGSSSADPLIGRVAPNFTLAALNVPGTANLSLSSYKGEPVVLNVWNSTCGPCIAEAPLLQQQWNKARSQGVVFLGLDFQDLPGDGKHFLQQYSITYPNVLDASGSVAINYGVSGTPETMFINRKGVIVAHVIGQLTAQSLQQGLQLITGQG